MDDSLGELGRRLNFDRDDMTAFHESILNLVGEDLQADDPQLREAAQTVWRYADSLNSPSEFDLETGVRLVNEYERVHADVLRAADRRERERGF
jgi:hypothetical protein